MKKYVKFLLAAVILSLLAAVFCLTAYAEGGITQFAVNTEEASDASELGAVNWYKNPADGKYYIFLPNGSDGSDMTVWFSADEAVLCGGTQLVSGQTTDVFAGGGNFVLTSGGNTYNVCVLKADGIGTMYINTESGSLSKVHADKEYKEPGTILIVDENGKVVYNGALDYIKGRGNSTWLQDKKPYNIKLNKKTDLFGMGKSKKWCLLANVDDSTMIRTSVVNDFAMQLGDEVTSDTVHLNMYVNGNYEGVYLLTEKVEIDDNRVEIYDLEDEMEKVNDADLDTYKLAGAQNSREWGSIKYAEIPNNPENITGGYLLELEKIYRYVNEPSGFITNIGQAVVVKEPEFASKAQVEYISAYYQEFEEALYSGTGYNSLGKHYSEYIDVESLARIYIIEEFGANFDGCSSSFYLYKDIDGKLVADPLWDVALTLGRGGSNDLINHVKSTTDPSILYIQTCFIGNHQEGRKGLLAQAFSHEDFRAEVQRIWNDGVKSNINTMYSNIDLYSELVRSSVAMNAVRWNTFGSMDIKTIDSRYTNEVNVVRNYINARYPFLSEAYSTDTYFVMYDGGEYAASLANDTKLYKSGDKATVLSAPASNDKLTVFDCWTTNPDGTGTKYKAGDAITVNGNVKLYAQWKADMSLNAIIYRIFAPLIRLFTKLNEFFKGIL